MHSNIKGCIFTSSKKHTIKNITIMENSATVQALKNIGGTKWVGNTTHSSLDKCFAAINLQTCNSGWYTPKVVRIPGLAGYWMLNEDGCIHYEARVIKQNDNSFLIEYLSGDGYNEFEEKYIAIVDAQ